MLSQFVIAFRTVNSKFKQFWGHLFKYTKLKEKWFSEIFHTVSLSLLSPGENNTGKNLFIDQNSRSCVFKTKD